MYENLRKVIEESGNIVFFGGAGVSTESNIPDFRSEKGIYNTKREYGVPPEVILSRSYFLGHTAEFYDYYRKNLVFRDARPNPAHTALAGLEDCGRLRAVITQNIDGLHQKAGSREVVELHGSVWRNYCMNCCKPFTLDYIMDKSGKIPRCDNCGGTVRPDVVLYEEELDPESLNKAVEYISGADLLVIGGTSLVVYPAAGLIQYFNGSRLVLINKSSTQYDSRADIVINDNIGKVLAAVI